MAKKKLIQYRERLSPSQIADGMNAAIDNAKRLLCDAKLLFENDRYSTATSIAALSVEESGKVSVLREIALARNQEEVHSAWRQYRSHTCKNRGWIVRDLFVSGARKLSDFRPITDKDADHPYVLDNVKQLGFYTDCLGKAHWSRPNDVIDRKLAQAIISVAEVELPRKKVTEREITLWIKHLQPVWRSNMEVMETALIAWHREMCAEGLISDDPDSMESFILGET